jgi:hypothetical protein
MKHLVLIFVFLLLVNESARAQSDTMIVDNGIIVKKFLISQVDSITFYVPPTVGIKDEGSSLTVPTQFSVSQNFPNPFNPSTQIQCYIPSAGKVKVKIFDINGGMVKEIFSGEKDQGEHTFSWDGTSSTQVASGVYLFSVQFNNSQLTKKIIYLK